MKIEILDAHFVFPEAVAAALLKRILGVPLVVTLRGKLNQLDHYPMRLRTAKWALNQADAVIAVASQLAERAVELGVNPARIHVIPNGIDSNRFSMVARSEARQRLGWTDPGRLIVSVGHLSPLKRFHLILEALPDLPADVRVVVIGGPGPDRDVGPELRRKIEQLKLAGRYSLAGPFSPDQVALALNAADLFVLASETEGSPNALLEALAAGTPVVASRVGEVERFVREGENGLLFNRDDQHVLGAKVANALGRDWDREKIRASVTSRTWERVAEEVHDVFFQVLERKNK